MPATPPLRPGLHPRPPDPAAFHAPATGPRDWPNWAATLDSLAGRATESPWTIRAPALGDRVNAFTRDTGTGPLRVLHIRDRPLFEEILRFLMRWPPAKPVPETMGAMLVQGLARTPASPPPAAFLAAPPRPRPATLDIALVRDGPYGNTPPPPEMDAASWSARSLEIRIEHEACHYAASRLFDGLRFDLQDELVADFAALMAVFESFSRDLFFACMGITPDGAIRPGARIANYLPPECPAPEAAAIVGQLATAAATLESITAGWSAAEWRDNRLAMIRTLTSLPLDDWSASDILQMSAAPSPRPL